MKKKKIFLPHNYIYGDEDPKKDHQRRGHAEKNLVLLGTPLFRGFMKKPENLGIPLFRVEEK